ncbi:MAG TPA: DUF2069 domain-containing protein [Dongiaceae bacterium]|nr:DUF2069 domain-containing protein [Dongiaceae bacterium]
MSALPDTSSDTVSNSSSSHAASTQSDQRKARLFSTLTLAHFYLLLGLLTLWQLYVWPASDQMKSILIILGFHLIPLLAFLPGLLKRRPRTHIWLCFFVLLYFCEGVLSAFRLPHIVGVLGLLEAVLTSGLFVTAMLAARFLSRLPAQ